MLYFSSKLQTFTTIPTLSNVFTFAALPFVVLTAGTLLLPLERVPLQNK